MLIWHDMGNSDFAPLAKTLVTDGVTVIGPSAALSPCIGCAGCWIKTPGTCVHHDGFQDLGALLGSHDELVLISRCVYGCFSPFVRTLFERSISYILPFFEVPDTNGPGAGTFTHHPSRYARPLAFTALFYGGAAPGAQATATRLVQANAANFGATVRTVTFYPHIPALIAAREARPDRTLFCRRSTCTSP